MQEDASVILIIGGSILVITYISLEMIIKPMIRDYLERKEKAAEKERAEQMIEVS